MIRKMFINRRKLFVFLLIIDCTVLTNRKAALAGSKKQKKNWFVYLDA
jgi:hypothetical protein